MDKESKVNAYARRGIHALEDVVASLAPGCLVTLHGPAGAGKSVLAHAVAYAMKIAKEMSPEQSILVNLSGRGDKDADFVAERLGL